MLRMGEKPSFFFRQKEGISICLPAIHGNQDFDP